MKAGGHHGVQHTNSVSHTNGTGKPSHTETPTPSPRPTVTGDPATNHSLGFGGGRYQNKLREGLKQFRESEAFQNGQTLLKDQVKQQAMSYTSAAAQEGASKLVSESVEKGAQTAGASLQNVGKKMLAAPPVGGPASLAAKAGGFVAMGAGKLMQKNADKIGDLAGQGAENAVGKLHERMARPSTKNAEATATSPATEKK